jgi:hypothetical protein
MLRDKENDNPLWWDIHGVLQHRKGFVHYYYDLHDFIDKKIVIGNRTYKINLYDVVILQYLIGWQKKKDTCSFEAQETIEKRLKIKHGTFSDAIKKWRALGIIVYKTIKSKGISSKWYVDIEMLMNLLHVNEAELINARELQKKQEIKEAEEYKQVNTDIQTEYEEPNPFE